VTEPTLTLLVCLDVEKPREYPDWYCEALRRWNADAEGVQILMLDQAGTADQTATGYPLWDILADTRAAWPQVAGEYICWQHTEFLWCRDRLRNTVAWLRENCPVMALGNLRRPGEPSAKSSAEDDRNARRETERITDHIRRGDWDAAAIQAETLQTLPWLGWKDEPQPNDAPVWAEDVFVARRDWIETTRFLEHGKPQIYQDVYDLMGASLTKLAVWESVPSLPRMPREVHRQVHLWHPRRMRCHAPDVRDAFLADPARWKGTLYASRPHWKKLLASYHAGNRDWDATHGWRRDPGGSVYRHAMDFERWLVDDDGGTVHRYLQQHRRMQEVA